MIDLELPEHLRWSQVITKERKVARRLADEALLDFPWWARVLGGILPVTYTLWGGRWGEEMSAWGEDMNLSAGDMALLNCTYEMNHVAHHVGSNGIVQRIFGCTAGVKWMPGLGMVHTRSLDWPLKQIGPATRIFKYRKGAREFMAVGMPGYVGVLSGMLPGAYSVTINWAVPERRPSFDFGPAFLLREVLETQDTYADAVAMLRNTPLSTSVFFVVCGMVRGEGCVIERTRGGASLRQGDVAQANHYVTSPMSHLNERLDDDTLEDSKDRAAKLSRALGKIRTHDLDKLVRTLDTVRCEDSHQQMAFCPATGEYEVRRTVRGVV